MANGWTPERRARQAELIRTWKPWRQSTGPKSAEGKATAARKGDKGGTWKAEREAVQALKRNVNDLLREQRDLLQRVTRQQP